MAALCDSQHGTALPVPGEPCRGSSFPRCSQHSHSYSVSDGEHSHWVRGGSLPVSCSPSMVCVRKPCLCTVFTLGNKHPVSLVYQVQQLLLLSVLRFCALTSLSLIYPYALTKSGIELGANLTGLKNFPSWFIVFGEFFSGWESVYQEVLM